MSSTGNANLEPPVNRNGFGVAIICALEREHTAVKASFDQFYEKPGQQLYKKPENDPNSYTLGRIGDHHIVLVRLPNMGKVKSSVAAQACKTTFPRIRLALVVGVCGGIPQPRDPDVDNIWLGDTIVSTYLIQTDFGKQYAEGVVRRDTVHDNLPTVSDELESFLNFLKDPMTRWDMQQKGGPIARARTALKKPWFEPSEKPGTEHDYVYSAGYRHKHRDGSCKICSACNGPEDEVCEKVKDMSCNQLQCDSASRIVRERPEKGDGTDEHCRVLFGTIASSDVVMKSSYHRDSIAEGEAKHDIYVLGFEMEGVGAWSVFPTIVVKSVCDYADSHKNKEWQNFAAAEAAATSKAILGYWRAIETGDIPAGSVAAQPKQPAAAPAAGGSGVTNIFGDGAKFKAGRDQVIGGNFNADNGTINIGGGGWKG